MRERRRGFRARLHEHDLRLFRAVAEAHSPWLDRLLPRLSRSADHSVLWFVVAGLLWLLGGRVQRRAALRGLLSLSAASAAANLPAKMLTRRVRPLIDIVPEARRLVRVPRSTSFPSGHSASAFAFAVGASLEMPALAVPLGITAAGVAASRVYTGVHYPGDVAAGAALGAGLAWASRSLWPVAPTEAAKTDTTFEHRHADPSPSGEGLTIAVNLAAGGRNDEAASRIRELLPKAEVEEIEIKDGSELFKFLDEAVDDARAIGVAGGDGSINTAAQVAVDAEKPLAVLPSGTLNHLARDLGLESLEDSARALASGDTAAMDIATIDGLVFLNTASFGSYVELVDARERLEKSIGKWPAVLVALVRVLRHSRPVEVEIEGERMKVWLAFIGNCQYHPSGFAPSWRERLDDGKLDVRLVNGSDPWARARLVASVLSGKLSSSKVYRQYLTTEMHVRSLQGPLRLARDGETFEGSEEFYVRKHSKPLGVYVPRRDEQPSDA